MGNTSEVAGSEDPPERAIGNKTPPGMPLFIQRLNVLVGRSGGVAPLSSASGVQAQLISRWLKGTSLPRSESLLRIAEACGVTMDWLAGRPGAIQKFSWKEAGLEQIDPGASVPRTQGRVQDRFVDVPSLRVRDNVVPQGDPVLQVRLREAWLEAIDVNPARVAVMTSMTEFLPLIRRGDLLLVEELDDLQDGVWVTQALHDTAMMGLWRLQLSWDGRMRVLPDDETVSSGDSYPYQILDKKRSQLFRDRAVGRVVWYWNAMRL